jgi:hypothetical protein
MDRLATSALVTLALLGGARAGRADTPVRSREATLGEVMAGPFRSSRLYTMPTADVVGAYVLSVSGDGSLLQEPGLLTSAGVLAVGFGDIAQLEYRHTAAISVTGLSAPLPAVGVQPQVPLPERSGVPALGVAFRLGVPRDEQLGATTVEETVTDLYFVVRERFARVPWLTLHGGARVSSARLDITGQGEATQRRLVLPAAGIELAMNPEARLVAEVVAAPRFVWAGAVVPGASEAPSIEYGMLARLGLRWAVLPNVTLDGTLGYQRDLVRVMSANGPRDFVHQWDIRLGAEVFVPWGALACRAAGVFCD